LTYGKDDGYLGVLDLSDFNVSLVVAGGLAGAVVGGGLVGVSGLVGAVVGGLAGEQLTALISLTLSVIFCSASVKTELGIFLFTFVTVVPSKTTPLSLKKETNLSIDTLLIWSNLPDNSGHCFFLVSTSVPTLS
jgi:hypothetical protein